MKSLSQRVWEDQQVWKAWQAQHPSGDAGNYYEEQYARELEARWGPDWADIGDASDLVDSYATEADPARLEA